MNKGSGLLKQTLAAPLPLKRKCHTLKWLSPAVVVIPCTPTCVWGLESFKYKFQEQGFNAYHQREQ